MKLSKYRLKDGSVRWNSLYYDLMPVWTRDVSPPGGFYNVAYYLIRPHEYVTDLFRHAKWFIQRGRRGYSDRDVWSIDYYLCSWMPQALQQLKRTTHGHPVGLSRKGWDEKLDRMARAFHLARKIQNYDYKTRQEYKLDLKYFRRDFNVFKMYFFGLWD